MRILLFSLLITIFCFDSSGLAQDPQEIGEQEAVYETWDAPTPLQFDEEQISSLKEQPEFDYTEEVQQESWWTKFKRYVSLQWQRFLAWLFGDYSANWFLVFLIQMIPYLILAGILIFAIWLFIRLNPGGSYLGKPEAGKVFLNEEEEIIQSKDIRKLIKEAVASENYRLAVRYYYLLILQQLGEAGFIDYQFPKTDEEYLAEIQQERLQKQFAQTTRIYDFIWYGNFEVTKAHFPKAEKEFHKMQELIKQKDEQNL